MSPEKTPPRKAKPTTTRGAAKATKPAADAPPAGRATINDIARLAGVSKKTVSRVINGSELVRGPTREKVQRLMDDLGYTPDPQARGLAFRHAFLIGLVFDNPTAQYIVNIQYGVLDALRGSGFELVVHPCDSKNPDYVEDIKRFVQQQKLYGVVLVPRVSEDQALAEMLQSLGVRYSRIASVPLDEAGRMVLTHDRRAGAEVAEYLESLGHRRFGLITGPKRYRSSLERGGGFLEGLKRRGIALDDEQVYEGGYTFESGVAGADALLALEPRPTAIFACNDEMAAGVYKAAQRRGLSVPADLSVVGYDDSPLARQLWPSLTTIHLPVRDLGREAAQLLLSKDWPRAVEPAAAFTVHPHLAVRDSTQPPRG
ncbi:LacI family DNA-binding transcriptional regulator [Silanimonas sp.]|jgi:LacI family transcriptional regulator|uniref:LacI family DNA-binding transcriptional regulator n=1 Tax=Silanimonas sp. TaxID=1929290 RepID=UPI0037CBF1A5